MARLAAPNTGEAPRQAARLVRNMTGTRRRGTRRRPSSILEARPAIDFLVSLMLGDTESELLPADRAWYDGSRASLSEALRRDLARVLGDGRQDEKGIGGGDRAARPSRTRRSAASADVVALAGRARARRPPPRGVLRRRWRCSGRAGPRRRVLAGETASCRDDAVALWPEEYRDGDRAPPRRSRRRAAGAPARAPRLARALRGRSRPRRPHGGARRRGPPGRSRPAAARRLRRAGDRRRPLGRRPRAPAPRAEPSYFARPYNYVFGGRDWHMFAYPLAETALDGDAGAVPAASVRLFKALGDESRLRILALLAVGRPLPDRDRRADGALQADHQPPPRPAPGGRPRDDHRGRRPHLLQPAARPDRGRSGSSSPASSAGPPRA